MIQKSNTDYQRHSMLYRQQRFFSGEVLYETGFDAPFMRSLLWLNETIYSAAVPVMQALHKH